MTRQDRLTIRPATKEDAVDIAPRLRKLDLQEAQRAGIEDISRHLQDAVFWGTYTWVVVGPDGIVEGIGGVEEGAGTPLTAVVWFMGTDCLVSHHNREFIRRMVPAVDAINLKYPTIWNTVDAENFVHIRWLLWAGFTLSPPVSNAGGSPFRILTRRKT